MNKKDLAMLRRRFAPEKNDISVIRGCFVNEKREIVSTFSKSPVSLPESEAEHYLSAFKKTLDGAVRHNQFTLPVHTGEPTSRLLRQLQSSELTDETAVSQLYKKIIDTPPSYRKSEACAIPCGMTVYPIRIISNNSRSGFSVKLHQKSIRVWYVGMKALK